MEQGFSKFRESDKSLKHELVSICLACTVVASWSLTQEVVGSSPFTVMTNIFVTEFIETFGENSYEKLQISGLLSHSIPSGFSKTFSRNCSTSQHYKLQSTWLKLLHHHLFCHVTNGFDCCKRLQLLKQVKV